ncbi:Uncharacterized protein TCM_024560 [Theobroma cacao]|uniref:Uncharacterized protein n=1 Tax=Theobroma cacao TaxID=3641 RepID=A0A061F3U7_THECC|nr:Uncharacterized protein TCM_024560 [Theobroma cacao]
MKEAVAKGYHPRKVSIVWDFPPFTEKGVTILNLQSDVEKQQGENEEYVGNPRETEDDSDYDLSMSSD